MAVITIIYIECIPILCREEEKKPTYPEHANIIDFWKMQAIWKINEHINCWVCHSWNKHGMPFLHGIDSRKQKMRTVSTKQPAKWGLHSSKKYATLAARSNENLLHINLFKISSSRRAAWTQLKKLNIDEDGCQNKLNYQKA